jgi:hypothetical protein
VSVKAGRSQSSIKAARAAVAYRARLYTGLKGVGLNRNGRRDKAPPAGGPGSGTRKGARTSRVVVQHIAPTTVLKVSVLFYLSMSIALVAAGVLLWAGARGIGLIDNVEGFMDEVGFTDFQIQAGPLLRAAVIGSAVLVVAGSLANLLMAVLYNLISDVVGGVKVLLAEDPEAPKG